MIREVKVTNFCGCLSLETGCRVIAWVHIIGNSFLFILILTLMIFAAYYFNQFNESLDLSSITVTSFIGE
jgi:hypothetical protein